MTVNIRKRKKKVGFSYTVYIDYGFVNGKRETDNLQTFNDKKTADNYKAKVQSEINNNTFIHVPNITFSEAIDEWMNNYVANECEPNTASGYELINRKYLKPCLGHIPFKVISSPSGIDIINSYYNYLRFDLSKETYIDCTGKEKNKKNLSYGTIEHHKAQISGILTYFMKNKKIACNICINTTIPKTEEEKMKDVIIDDIDNFDDDELYEDEEFVTPEQAVQILNLFMNTEMMVPVFLAALVGLRRSEIAGILKSKVDLLNKKLTIKNTRVRCGKKTIFKKKNKNKKSTRVVYLPQIVIDVINLELKRQEKNKSLFKDNYIESNFLCVYDNGEPLKVDYISSQFKRVFDNFIKEETKKNPDFKFPYVTLHKLRHLNISALLACGCVLTDVQASVGHSTIETTMNYTHHYTQGKQEIANTVDELYLPLLKISI